MKKTVLSFFLKMGICLVLTLQSTYGQQQAMFTQYMFNGLAINPAYAGSHEALSLTALARKQWTGLDGAPSTQTFSAHSPINSQRIALGVLFVNDQIGVTQQTGGHAFYAYRIQMPKGTLSMGLQAGFNSYRANVSRLLLYNPGDPNFSSNTVNKFMPNFGVGFYYYNERFYVGLSVPQILDGYYNKEADRDVSKAQQSRHYFLTGGYVFDITPSVKIKPSALVKAVNGAPVAVDLNANVLLKEVIWLGVSCRSLKSMSALTELQLTDQFRLGYAYDFPAGKKATGLTYGSHELMVNYRFAFTKNKVVTPRYF